MKVTHAIPADDNRQCPDIVAKPGEVVSKLQLVVGRLGIRLAPVYRQGLEGGCRRTPLLLLMGIYRRLGVNVRLVPGIRGFMFVDLSIDRHEGVIHAEAISPLSQGYPSSTIKLRVCLRLGLPAGPVIPNGRAAGSELSRSVQSSLQYPSFLSFSLLTLSPSVVAVAVADIPERSNVVCVGHMPRRWINKEFKRGAASKSSKFAKRFFIPNLPIDRSPLPA